jgi:cysteine-rich repeat protein
LSLANGTALRSVVLCGLVGCASAVDESGDSTSGADSSSTAATTSTTDPSTTTTTTTTDATSTGVDVTSDTTGTPAECGNGDVEGVEQCDDGNDAPGDGCEPGCVLPSGEQIWEVAIDSGDDDVAYDLAVTAEGDIWVVGSRRSESGLDTWIATYDAAGEQTGETILDLGEGDDDESFSIAPLGVGWVLAGVASPQGVEDGDDALLVALDGDLATVWSQRIDAGLDDRANAVSVDADANGGTAIAVAGNLASADTFADVWFAVYDTSGAEQWSRTEDGPGSRNDDAHGVAWLADGGLAVVGEVSNGAEADLWMSVREPDGGERWSDVLDFEFGDDVAMSVIADGDGIVVTGSIASALTNSEEVWVARFGADGTPGAVISYNSTGFVFDGGEDAVVALDAVFVAGVTAAEQEQRNALVGRWPAMGGEPAWVVDFDGGPGLGDAAHAIALLPDGSVVAAGEITVLGQGSDAWIRRWSP